MKNASRHRMLRESIAAIALCTARLSDASSCSLPEVLARETADVKNTSYVGGALHAFTSQLHVKDEIEDKMHKEYLSLIKELDICTYIVVDRTENNTKIDIFIDKKMDGTLQEHYRLLFPPGIVAVISLKIEKWKIEHSMRNAYREHGLIGVVKTLEESLAVYRVQHIPNEYQTRYATSLNALLAEFCPIKSYKNNSQ